MKKKMPCLELPRKPGSDGSITHLLGQATAMKQRGATSIEYVLLAGLIGLAAVLVLTQTGSGVTSGYENLQTKVEQA